MGRPTVYTSEISKEICERLASGQSLNRICKDDHMPHRATVMRWLLSEDEIYNSFCDNYAKAREIQYQLMADDIIDIADDGVNDYVQSADPENEGYRLNGENVGRSRLRVDTRKWFMSKVLPKFADKQQVESKTTIVDKSELDW